MSIDGVSCDLHSHTNFTDGENSIHEMADAANKAGLHVFAITEHVRGDSPWIREYIAGIEDARKNSRCKIILGFETKLLDMNGTLDIPEYAKKRAEILICSLHRIPGLHDMEGDLKISGLDKKKTKGIYIEALKAICRNPDVDIIGHPFDLLEKYDVPMPDEKEMRAVAKAISDSGKIVEINTNYNMPPVNFIRICREHGIRFSIGSDAHGASRVGDVSGALEMLEDAGGSREDLAEVCYK